MKYRVEYRNPNNITDRLYVFETRLKSEHTEFMANARKYSGSYTIISNERISEAKPKGAKKS